jgi:hypothetical protein
MEVKVFPCEKCGRNVPVKERPGDAGAAWLPRVLVGECGHVVAERPTKYEPWQKAD